MSYIKVTLEDETNYITEYNGSFRLAKKHYLGRVLTLNKLSGPHKRCVDVQQLESLVSSPEAPLWPEELCPWLHWDDLNRAEKAQARESYLSIRESEEDRDRDDVTSSPDYTEPIDWRGVLNCRFQRMPDGYIYVDL